MVDEVRAIGRRIQREPVLVVTLVQAVIVCAVSFGLNLTDAQGAAVLTLTGAALALVARGQVSPVRGSQDGAQGE